MCSVSHRGLRGPHYLILSGSLDLSPQELPGPPPECGTRSGPMVGHAKMCHGGSRHQAWDEEWEMGWWEVAPWG